LWKNILIAKNRDSESAMSVFTRPGRFKGGKSLCSCLIVRIARTQKKQGLSAILTFVNAGFSGASRIALQALFQVMTGRVGQVARDRHQHFLKRETVLLKSLVYSG
jgi:hypothetical protein